VSTFTDFLGRRDSTVVRQKTLKSPIHCSGIGLHSGDEIAMTLRPAPAGTGILFRRTDKTGRDAEIAADWRNVVDTRLCTTIGNGAGTTVATIEHLMSAFAGCEIDNAVVELDGQEVPVMDGSAAPFVFLLECAGTVEQAAPRRTVKVLKAIEVRDGDKLARLTPADGFSVSCEIDFDSDSIGRQICTLDVNRAAFKADIARARTFGFLHEVNQMRAMGLARGGSLDNAVVIGSDGVMNEGGLRYGDEFVRHKMLDAIGDLYLAGAPLAARFEGVRCGHAINNKLLHALFADDSAWVLTGGRAGTAAPAAAAMVAWPEGRIAAAAAV